MKSIEYFPNLLKDLLLKNGISLTQLANQIGTSPKNVIQWLMGSTIPNPFSVLKISKVIGGNELELFESALALWHGQKALWSGRKKGTFIDEKEFNFREALEEIIHHAHRGVRGIPDDALDDIVKIWEKTENYN
jgi:transcriptional regulator with XRE-family HTH domain